MRAQFKDYYKGRTGWISGICCGCGPVLDPVSQDPVWIRIQPDPGFLIEMALFSLRIL